MSVQDSHAPRGGAPARPNAAVVVRPPSNTRRRARALRRFWLPAVLLLALAAGGLTGIVSAYQLNHSAVAGEVSALATYRPSLVTRVYADDGETIIGEFALERRFPLRYDEIPPVLKNAILAVEDVRFNEHMGIDPIRIAGAAFKNLTTGSREGGSTLTQQLVKNLFLTREQTLERKFKEWVMALQVERFYTKNQIMEMYVNHIFLGANSYGFEAAAQTYFGKATKDLTVDEAALLAGIPRSTARYSPTVNPEAAKERRDLVLDLMARNEFISASEAAAAKARPIRLADTAYYPVQQERSSEFQYPVEEIRRYLEREYTTRVAQSGLTVYSTINVEAQKEAYKALRAGLRRYDSSRGAWRSDYPNIGAQPGEGGEAQAAPAAAVTPPQLAAFKHPDWYANKFEKDDYVRGLVTKIDAARNEAQVRFGAYTATVTTKDMGRSARQPKTEFKVGDLPEWKIVEADEEARTLKVELSQVPAVSGAIMTVNAKNGETVAMIGGYDFNINKFNAATQAYRQTGSAFKPFIYAAAVEWGLSPESPVSGAPIRRGNWQPHNFDGSVGHGTVPLKTALAKSYNVGAVHLLDMVGIQTGAQMVRRFGITVPMAPYLPSALGATEVPLDQMVSAYSAFPNKGVRHQQHLIRRVLDRDGNTLEEWEPTTFKVMSEYVALTMVELMQAVTSSGGTAPGASSIGHPTAGKTGTVNDHTDVWFVGYTPGYVTGVWMGYAERKQSLGRGMTGGQGALPIWVDFMKDFMKDKPKEKFEKAPPMPEDIKELHQQRMREMAEERERLYASYRGGRGGGSGDGATTPVSLDEPKLEMITLPPPAGEHANTPTAGGEAGASVAPKPAIVVPSRDDDDAPASPPPSTRPREVEPQKKKGKKGGDDEDKTP